jgi:hypothetical protein
VGAWRLARLIGWVSIILLATFVAAIILVAVFHEHSWLCNFLGGDVLQNGCSFTYD